MSEEKEGDDDVKSELAATFLSKLEGISTARKYLIRFDVHIKMMAAYSNVQNDMYRVQ